MKNFNKTLILTLLVVVLGVSPLHMEAQSKRQLNTKGDYYFETENYIEAETYYGQSVDKEAEFQSLYNLACSQEKQQEVEEAVTTYEKALPMAKTDLHRASTHYNLANTMISQQDQQTIENLEKLIDHYKSAIRLDPQHDKARHNLAAAQISLDMAKQQQEQEQQQQQQQDQENQEQEEQEEQENEDQEQEQEQQQENQKQQQEAEEKREEEKKSVDKNEIENILKMVEKEDAEVQQKMRKQTKTDNSQKKKKW